MQTMKSNLLKSQTFAVSKSKYSSSEGESPIKLGETKSISSGDKNKPL